MSEHGNDKSRTDWAERAEKTEPMGGVKRADKRSERGEMTRRLIVGTATRLFAEQGYEGTSIETVLQECGISRGALYHHFHSKEALFTAALDAVEARVAATVAAAAGDAANPLDALRSGCAAWLGLAQVPEVRRIVLIDAPAVVGWQFWREMDGEHALGLLQTLLGLAAQAGRLRPEMVPTSAYMLLAVLVEMALLIARADDADDAARNAREAVELLVSRLMSVEPGAAW